LGTNGEAPAESEGPKVLGIDPESGMEVTLRTGRFGPYVQLGEPADKTEKPKRGSIPKDMPPASVDLPKALSLLSLPREIGKHPETGKPITAAIGRYGPYVSHDGKFASLSGTDEVFTVGINRAVDLLASQKKGRAQAEVLKELGAHPEDGAPVQILNGRYGPYIKHQKTNAPMPKGRTAEDLTLDEAVPLLAARAGGKKAPKKAAAKKLAAKKATGKKTAAKKTAGAKS
jgi:DNA topoisomerase-1